MSKSKVEKTIKFKKFDSFLRWILFFSFSFLFRLWGFILQFLYHVRSLTIYTAAVFVFLFIYLLFTSLTCRTHFIASSFSPRSLPFCFSYISHIFSCVVSQINYMQCFMRCHNSISCMFFQFFIFGMDSTLNTVGTIISP